MRLTPAQLAKADKRFKAQVKAGKITCNCGGPQMGTDHSPDCQVNLAWDEIKDEVRSEDY